MTSFDRARQLVAHLVQDFRAHEHRYLSPEYQEVEARKDFIDKFWKALGWDVDHDVQKNPYEQDVKVELGQEQAGARKRADYAFSIAPNYRDVRFFVEAKKPHINIENADDYFQTIRYGWNSQNPLAVLTDFEQFHILDCRYKPSIDTALSRAVPSGKFHYSEYLDAEKFARIYWLFAREAVACGSIEKFAADMPKPGGRAVQRGLFPGRYQSIDESFLDELDEIRADLARGFKKTNPDLSGEDLTELVQRTIDRLVFIRFLEDRLIENQHLVATFGDKATVWEDFIAASRRLDGVYNGIVFKRHTTLDDRDFAPDAALFSAICEDLSHINSPYDFNAIPIHILGSIYERFLGKVIVATNKRARVEEKPEVRKAGGVYYTPEYIVRYIVENTVGKLIEGKSPAQIAGMKFADIACGSGSFLLGVYDLLIRYHAKLYNDNPGKAKEGDVMERDDGLHLTLQKKREILLNNIFGVDIDAQAVEVAQLSLYLKLLQDETPGSTRAHQLEFRETLLPSLNKNITCGNSLIGTDIISGELFEPVEERKLNPMDFEDRFPEVMNRGGFDAIIGNPPYSLILSNVEKGYLRSQYGTLFFKINLFAAFIEKGLRLVKNNGGTLAFIVPNLLFANDSLSKLRHVMLKSSRIRKLINCGDGVFEHVSMPTMIFVLEKAASVKKDAIVELFPNAGSKLSLTNAINIPQERFLNAHNYVFETAIPSVSRLLGKLQAVGQSLEEALDVNQGVITGDDKRYLSEKTVSSHSKPTIRGRDVERYVTNYPRLFVEYIRDELACPRTEDLFDVPEKLLMRRTGDRPVASLDTRRCYNVHTLYSCRNKTDFSIKYLLALLNSRLLEFIYRQRLGTEVDRTFAEIKIVYIRHLPIRFVNLAQPADKTRHDKIVLLVEQMLSGKKQLAAAQSDKDKDFYENKCAGLDRQIDAVVYELYDLTKDEIKIVEQAGLG